MICSMDYAAVDACLPENVLRRIPTINVVARSFCVGEDKCAGVCHASLTPVSSRFISRHLSSCWLASCRPQVGGPHACRRLAVSCMPQVGRPHADRRLAGLMQTAGWRAACMLQVGGPHACPGCRASCMPQVGGPHACRRLVGLMQTAGWRASCMPRLAGLMQAVGWRPACMPQVGGPHACRRLLTTGDSRFSCWIRYDYSRLVQKMVVSELTTIGSRRNGHDRLKYWVCTPPGLGAYVIWDIHVQYVIFMLYTLYFNRCNAQHLMFTSCTQCFRLSCTRQHTEWLFGQLVPNLHHQPRPLVFSPSSMEECPGESYTDF